MFAIFSNYRDIPKLHLFFKLLSTLSKDVHKLSILEITACLQKERKKKVYAAALPLLFSWGGPSYTYKVYTIPANPFVSAPKTGVWVCVRGQGVMSALLPEVATPPPAGCRDPGPWRCSGSGRKWNKGGGLAVARECGVTARIWFRGILCPPHLSPDPGTDLSLYYVFYHKDASRIRPFFQT